MKRLVAALGLVLIAALSPASAWAQPVWPGMGSPGATPAHRPHSRPGPPFIHRPFPVFGCCLGFPYVTPPPPVIVVPSVLYVVPSPPTLLYVPPARPEPAPEITLATGRWERHGNGAEYPYTWVWVGAAPAR